MFSAGALDMQMQTFNAWVVLSVWRIAPQLGLGWTEAHAPVWYWVFVLLGCDFGILIVLLWAVMQQT